MQQRLERERSEAVAEVDSNMAVPDFDQLKRLQNAGNTELIELRGTCQRQQADLACVREVTSTHTPPHLPICHVKIGALCTEKGTPDSVASIRGDSGQTV